MIPILLDLLRDWLLSTELWRFAQVFQWPSFRALASIVMCFFFVVLLGKRTILWLMKQKIGDNPEFYNADLNQLTKQKSNTPTMGGILIVGAIATATLVLADMRNFYVQMSVICMVLYAGLGAFDDWLKLTSARRTVRSREGLRSWEKLVFQVGWALLLGFFIHFYGANNEQTHILNLPGQRTFLPGTLQLAEGVIVLGPWAFGLLAVIVISGSSNAVNLTDGMDGLASGIMTIVSFVFIVLALVTGISRWATFLLIPHIPGSEELAIVAGAMVGSCLGFLWWNCHPAQVFMGDTGSLSLGALIGYLAVVLRQELLLLIVGGVLVVEALSVMLQVGYFKISGGSRIFRCAPIHHHFHLGGWNEQQVVVRFWLISALLAALGLATLKLR
jgi:phospho-N-acetylmuramoyl-pentapeptide-transferase